MREEDLTGIVFVTVIAVFFIMLGIIAYHSISTDAEITKLAMEKGYIQLKQNGNLIWIKPDKKELR